MKGSGKGLSLSDVLGRFTGRAAGFEFTNAPMAIWGGQDTIALGTGSNTPLGSAPSGDFPASNYLATV